MAITRPQRAPSGVPEKKARVSRARTKVDVPPKKSAKKVAVTGRVAVIGLRKRRTAHIAVSEKEGGAVAVPIQASTSTTLGFPKKISLAQLSPFRFPVDQQKVLAQTARFSGLIVMFFGAVLTLFNMFGAGVFFSASDTLLRSELISGTLSYTCDTTSPNYNKEFCSTAGFTGVAVDETPDATFNIDAKNPLTESVSIHLTVSAATFVQMYVRNESTGEIYPLPSVTSVSDMVWRTTWFTTTHPDGVYTLKASITNRFGTYNVSAPGEFIVENQPITESASIVTNTSTSTLDSQNELVASTTISTEVIEGDTTTNATDVLSDIVFTLVSKSPLMDTAIFNIVAPHAAEIKMYAERILTDKKQFLGYAVYTGNSEWKYYWNTRSTENGIYAVHAYVRPTSGSSVTKTLRNLTVENAQSALPGTVVATTNDTETLESLASSMHIRIPDSSNFSGSKNVLFTVERAEFIEVYAVPKGSLIKKFLGLARKLTATEWVLTVDTTQIPNGEYSIHGVVRFPYGDMETARVGVKVQNSTITSYTKEQTTYIESLDALAKEVDAAMPVMQPITLQEQKPVVTTLTQSTENTTEMNTIDVTSERTLTPVHTESFGEAGTVLIEDFERAVRIRMQEYAEALRADDTEAMEELRAYNTALQKKLIDDLEALGASVDTLDRVRAQVDDVMKISEARVIRQEKIIKERIGAAVHDDSDADGIGDYDEVKLYKTDPYRADTDRDGFTDAVEILRGFDPTQSVQESLVAYESPKDTGVVRADVLTVHAIATIDGDMLPTETPLKPRALISGKGLPNSFVTLYIFSTPVIVTVKTDADGSWNYVFDKELEDGVHEVYVGMTDNAGRVVAKSEVFSFVKTAEAFSPVSTGTESIVATTVPEPSFVTQQALLIIASIAVLALGLILILLGMHVELWYKRKLIPQ